jgi:peptidoglycan-associated lipoprotein
MRATPSLLVLALAGLFAACGGKPAPEQPAPDPTPAPVAPTSGPSDADEAARRAREDSIAKASQMAEQARAVAADLAAMINFEYDQAAIRSTDQSVLDRKAAILGVNPNVRLQISGHADERGSDEYNLALGNRRAAAAKRYLEGKGIDGSRMEVVSYGEERPLNTGHDEAAYAQNRRDEFQVTAGGDRLVAPQ